MRSLPCTTQMSTVILSNVRGERSREIPTTCPPTANWPCLNLSPELNFNFATGAAAPHMAGFYYPQPMAAAQAAAAQTNYLQGLQGYTFNNFGASFPQGYISGLPGMQVAAASYGVPNQSAAVSAAAAAGQLAAAPTQQAALQGLATQQPSAAAAAAAAGVVHVPYPPGAAAAASAVQQFQMNGQPTTLAL